MLSISDVLTADGVRTMNVAVRALAPKCRTITGTATLSVLELRLTKKVARHTADSTSLGDGRRTAEPVATEHVIAALAAAESVVGAGQGAAGR